MPTPVQQLNRALLGTLMSRETAAIVADRLEELEHEKALLRQSLQMIADESQRHHEHNPISGKDRLPQGYTTIMNIACDALK